MELVQLEELLKSDALDQETKLAIIDLVAFGNDPVLTQDIIQLLTEWKESDQMDLDIMRQQIEAIKKTAEENQQRLQKKIDHSELIIDDILDSQQKIAVIRQSILNQP